MSRFLSVLPLALALLMLPACSVRLGGSKSLDTTLADLRTENKQLRDQLAQAQGQIKELLAAGDISAAPASDAGSSPSPFTPEELALALPRVVTLTFAGSAGIDRRNPQAPRLVMDVETLDGRNRFVQVVGRLRITAAQGPAPAARPLADITLQPVELREAFRSGILGTRYAVEVPLPADALASATAIRVEAVLLLPTGETLTAEREFATGE